MSRLVGECVEGRPATDMLSDLALMGVNGDLMLASVRVGEVDLVIAVGSRDTDPYQASLSSAGLRAARTPARCRRRKKP
ncbi:hypothetical protein [Streptosporangium sp. LJ11]|uniref:hypothetical protein n=1 Tax=Streptosporangium sp. LJ11 TaxID=3436927 RepID=UPI003F7A5A6E